MVVTHGERLTEDLTVTGTAQIFSAVSPANKLSMSPRVDFPKAAQNMGSRFIFAWKPNPAFVAYDEWNPELLRIDMKDKLAIASANDCIMQIHLDDISTARYEPQRPTEWNNIAQECAEDYA